MEELELITLKAIENYYNYLDNLGYADNDDMNNVLVLSFISDMLNIFPLYIIDDDCDIILKAVMCLSDKCCFIPHPHFMTQESLFKDSNYYKLKQFRISEDSLFRLTENNLNRITD